MQFAPRDNAGVGPGVDITPTRDRRALVGQREGTPTLELRLLPDDLPVPPALVTHQGGGEVIILITESNFSQLPVGVYSAGYSGEVGIPFQQGATLQDEYLRFILVRPVIRGVRAVSYTHLTLPTKA